MEVAQLAPLVITIPTQVCYADEAIIKRKGFMAKWRLNKTTSVNEQNNGLYGFYILIHYKAFGHISQDNLA